MSLHCYDSVVASAIPPAAVVLGYIDGDYRTVDALTTRFKGTTTKVVTITTGIASAVIIDCEKGDASPSQAAEWCISQLSQGSRPTVYGSESTHDAVVAEVRRLHVRADLVDFFLADWTHVGPGPLVFPKHLPAGYVGWQFAGNVPVAGGHSIDASVVSEVWARRHGWGLKAKHYTRPIIKIVR